MDADLLLIVTTSLLAVVLAMVAVAEMSPRVGKVAAATNQPLGRTASLGVLVWLVSVTFEAGGNAKRPGYPEYQQRTSIVFPLPAKRS